MKRFHVHVAVDNLSESIRFYQTLFGAEPTVQRSDYAKWMLDDPRINFAISERDRKAGINHLGLQVDSTEELNAMRAQLRKADKASIEQAEIACCYARSDKHWVTDPSGVAWETFHTLDTLPFYGEGDRVEAPDAACCAPAEGEDVPATECCDAPATCCT